MTLPLACTQTLLAFNYTSPLIFSRESAQKYFRHGKRLNWPDRSTSGESIRAVHKLSRLRDLVLEHTDNTGSSLVDLLERMLKYDPYDRPTAKEALDHPFFHGCSWL
eukprot:c25203_g1_i5 orf=151-471(+)